MCLLNLCNTNCNCVAQACNNFFTTTFATFVYLKCKTSENYLTKFLISINYPLPSPLPFLTHLSKCRYVFKKNRTLTNLHSMPFLSPSFAQLCLNSGTELDFKNETMYFENVSTQLIVAMK